ncbi:MAG: MCP four helix bundle domain-containing protein [Comamonas sp.]|nr:MCP four helix bundle domain-containing protein [Comamonas sp.]
MNRFKISTRLSALLITMCLLLLGIGAAGVLGMAQTSEGMRSVYEDRVVPLAQLKAVSDAYAVDTVDTAHKVRNGNLTAAQGRQNLADGRKKIETNWNAYAATDMDAEETRLMAELKPLMGKADEAIRQLDTLLGNDDSQGLEAFIISEMYPAIDPLQGTLGELIGIQLLEAGQNYRDTVVTYETLRTVAIGTIVLGVLIAVLIGGTMVRQIGRDLGYAVQVTDTVAQGDLTVEIRASGQDEVSHLLRSLESMRTNLARVVAGVRGNAEGVAMSSSEIASGNNDLSSRTEEQASALEETAASMEQLNATVKQNAENARQANQLAISASSVASQGGEVVAQVVGTMKGIDESGRRIADIIGVIDGIAFQTNILALNAAVEAARAGEQGRGFAVVASEVRSLAGRSAEAAKEIKNLITDSVTRVEAGSALADKAGSTMTEVVEAIRRVTDIMGEISAASSEQSAGVSQVGEAIVQMDQVTQQNAALVEEMAAAANSLSHQSQELVSEVSVFKLAQGTTRAATSRPATTATPAAAHAASPAAAPRVAAKPATAPAKATARPAKAPALTAAPAKPAAAPAAGHADDWETF